MAALSAVMMAVMISAVFVWIPINGTFGWSGLPFAYNVFGLATMEVLLPIIEAVLHRYCDDYIGYGTLRHLAHDRLLIVQVITALFQEQALSAKKHVPPTQRTHVIGWVVDLQSATVTLKLERSRLEKDAAHFLQPSLELQASTMSTLGGSSITRRALLSSSPWYALLRHSSA